MVKIDQKFLDEVARQHNIDYPKEYWESGGKQANESKEAEGHVEYTYPKKP